LGNFVKHSPCPSCGSRDNLALYDDGSAWCFGCHYVISKNKIPSQKKKEEEDNPSAHRSLPDDFGHEFGPDSISWFSSYGFSIEEMIRRNVGHSPSKNQTIFTFPETGLWQARNHWPQSKVKYFTSGNHDNILPIYEAMPYCEGGSAEVVLTEDCLSAIKIASLEGRGGATSDAMPLLGTHLPSKKLIALRRLYSRVVVWLDHDKGKEANTIANRCKMVGLEARCISTEKDPKELEDGEIINRLGTT
jgi:hypothetical protein